MITSSQTLNMDYTSEDGMPFVTGNSANPDLTLRTMNYTSEDGMPFVKNEDSAGALSAGNFMFMFLTGN